MTDAPTTAARAQELFDVDMHDARVRCDQIFARLMIAQWIFGLVIAIVASPLAYAGPRASIHVHVYFAAIVGGALALGPIALIRLRPGSLVTSHVVAVAQMLWSALFIHLTGGRIETHFHVFGSLAFLGFYRDWRVLLTATLVVSADHLARGVLAPESVYGIANPEWWRFLEHAGWVVFENTVLVVSILEAKRRAYALARGQADVEAANASVERKVEERTKELAASREQYRTLVEGTDAVPWLFDRDERRFTYIGPHIERITGIAVGDWQRPGVWDELVHPEDHARIVDAADAQSSGAAPGEVEFRMKNAAGSYIWLRSTIARASSEASVRGIMFDVSAQRAMEAELRQAQKLSAIGSLAAGVAHELNTPIQFLNDNMTFLARSFDRVIGAAGSSPKIERLRADVPVAIAESFEGLRRVTSIVRAMKEFSHTGSRQKHPVSLQEAIETTATVARNEWKYTADLDIVVAPDVPPVPVVRDELNQVLLNMIVNAAHAIEEKNTGARGRIGIHVDRVGDSVEIRVSDDGAGIPDDAKARVFEPFFTTKDVGKGTGQGLAIAWSVVVDKHGGTLKVESELGRGTTFVIGLPLAA